MASGPEAANWGTGVGAAVPTASEHRLSRVRHEREDDRPGGWAVPTAPPPALQRRRPAPSPAPPTALQRLRPASRPHPPSQKGNHLLALGPPAAPAKGPRVLQAPLNQGLFGRAVSAAVTASESGTRPLEKASGSWTTRVSGRFPPVALGLTYPLGEQKRGVERESQSRGGEQRRGC